MAQISFVPISDAPRRVVIPEGAPAYFSDYVNQAEEHFFILAQAIRQLQAKVAALEAAQGG